ncbi:MAG TPA: hypothetical protein VFA04_27315 [Bryobacteraceae bacterium]|nr:hypothetical protein [Bryobacteraceae bacterium]
MVQAANQARPRPAAPARAPESRLIIAVVFTGVQSTLVALRRAGELAAGLGAAIRVFDAHVVPYPLPLSEPDIHESHLVRQVRTVADTRPLDTTCEVILCRDPVDGLRAVLPACALVLLGGPRRWWPTRQMRLARALRRAGHEVLFLDCPREKQHA